jgi:hypothetical protein
MSNTITIHNFNGDSIPYCEAQGLAKVFQAYADHATNESIMEGGIGFNENSGIVYIALENGIQICSAFGHDVEYLVTDSENGHEEFFNFYEDALTLIEHYNERT